ncbi:hypothetical protein [Solidesulfovibrio sp. C21]|uniref:hypothetical protein n=1 Tax=Solidesulfovibrio sp. C21 TaxID=3398613 RepID=UPI0039FC685C
MKLRSALFSVIGVLTLYAASSQAAKEELLVSFANDTNFETQAVTITAKKKAGGGAIYRRGMYVEPGGSGFIGFDGGSSLTNLSMDMGVARFEFIDVTPLAGRSHLNLRVAFDEASATPLLILEGRAEQNASGVTRADTPGDAFGATLDAQAGPIWNNDHAKKRCPEIVQEWLRENPGQSAAWNGQWRTTRESEMSVCGLKTAPAPEPGMEFTQEAGPIWNNVHAKKRCPEVLAEWMQINPGKDAAWTGHWWTTRENEMSVCVLRLAPSAEAPQKLQTLEDYGDGAVRVAGRFTPLLARNESGGVPFTDLLAAKTMADIRTLAGLETAGDEDDPNNREHALTLKARFSGSVWLASIHPNNDDYDMFTGYHEDKVRPGRIFMRAYAENEAREKVIDGLRDKGWHPWALQSQSGPGMNDERSYKYCEAAPDAQEAWALVMKEYSGSDPRPYYTRTLFLPNEGYEAAVANGKSQAPGFLFQTGNSIVMTMEYVLDADVYVGLSR